MYEAKLAHVEPDTVPARPADGRVLRRFLFNVTASSRWRVLTAAAIGANVCIEFLHGSALLHHNEDPEWIHVQEVTIVYDSNGAPSGLSELFFFSACRP